MTCFRDRRQFSTPLPAVTRRSIGFRRSTSLWVAAHDRPAHPDAAGSVAVGPMSATIEFKSHVPVAQRAALEALVFFNSCQERVSACIADAIEKFGAPEIVADRDRLRIHMKGLPDVQSLFAIDSDRAACRCRRLCAAGCRARHRHAPEYRRGVRQRRPARRRTTVVAAAARGAPLDPPREGRSTRRAVLRDAAEPRSRRWRMPAKAMM